MQLLRVNGNLELTLNNVRTRVNEGVEAKAAGVRYLVIL